MISKWRNSRVEEYLPTSVHSFFWGSEELKQAWNPPLRRPIERKRKRSSSSEKDSSRDRRSPQAAPPLTLVTVEAEIHEPAPFIPPPPVSPIIAATPTEIPTGTFVVVEQQQAPPSFPGDLLAARIEAMEDRMAKNIQALANIMATSTKKCEARLAVLEKHPNPVAPVTTTSSTNSDFSPTAEGGVAYQAQQPQIRQQEPPPAQNGPSEETAVEPASPPLEDAIQEVTTEPAHPVSPPSAPQTTRPVPLIDLTLGDEADVPPHNLKRADRVHHEAHLWLQELYDEEEYEPDLFPHKHVLQHTPATRYFVSDQVKYSWFKKVPCLVTLWQMQTLALPVDQSWVRVRKEEDSLVYYLAPPETTIPAMYKPFLIKGTTIKPVKPTKGSPSILKEFRPVLSQPLREATSLHPSDSTPTGWSSFNPLLKTEVLAIEKALPSTHHDWPPLIPLQLPDTDLHAYFTGPILQIKPPSDEFKELFALLPRSTDAQLLHQELSHRKLAFSQCMLRESIRFNGELIEQGTSYHTLKKENAPTFARLQSLQKDASSFCLAQATSIFKFHLEAALKCKKELVTKLISRVEPMELQLLLRSASCISQHIFPLDVMTRAQEIIVRTLDTGVLRHELKARLLKASPSPRSAPPFRGSSSFGDQSRRQGGAFRGGRQTARAYLSASSARGSTSGPRGGRKGFYDPASRHRRGNRATTYGHSATSRFGGGHSNFTSTSRVSTPRGRGSSSRRGRRPRGSR